MVAFDSKLLLYVIAIAIIIVIIYKIAEPSTTEGIARIPVPGLARIQGFSAAMVSPLYRKASLNTGY